jgi:hypothetical protein
MAIDVGNGASDLGTNATLNYTQFDLTNPCNARGYITSIEVWFRSTGSGLQVGFFYGSGNRYHCRNSVNIGAVTAGSKQTFTGFSLKIDVGDFMGVYFSGGAMAAATTGGAGVGYISGVIAMDNVDHIYTMLANYRFGCYATGVETQWPANYLHARRDRLNIKRVSGQNQVG